MNRKNKIRILQNKAMKILPCLAMIFATYASNRVCFIVYHQEKRPDELKELRKF